MIERLFDKEVWYSLYWFSWNTLFSFNWDNAFILSVIPIIPLIYFLKWLFHFRFRQKVDIALLASDLKKINFMGWLRFIPNIFFILFVTLVVVALARPQKSSEKIESHRQGMDIVIALDISESMLLEDLKPNRLEAAKEILKKFIAQRQSDRIGVVVFSGAAFTLAPLTTDHALLTQSVDEINAHSLDTGSTAIGNAIAVAINRFNESVSKSKVLILISDGDNTEGNLGPETAAQLAYAHGIKIYSIGIGKNGSVPFGRDENGKILFVKSSINEEILNKIARTGKGKFLKATDDNSLKEIFRIIDSLEKVEIREKRYNDNKDFYQIYLSWSLVFLMMWIFTKSTFLTNALED